MPIGVKIRFFATMNIIKELKLNLKQLFHHIIDKAEEPSPIHAPYISAFLQSCNEMIIKQKSVRSPATVRNYITATNAFRLFLDDTGVDSHTAQLTSQLVRQFAMWLRNRNVSPNTIACYMRSMRALCNYTCSSVPSPFCDVSTANARTHKRSITIEEINALINLDLSASESLQMYRDIFVFSVYSFGMPFIDVYNLRHDCIHDKTIFYYRHKTGQEIMVPVSDKIMNIIKRYARKDSPFIFPLLSESEDRYSYSKYQQQLAYYNRILRLLARKAGINHTLTSYVARHTWASIASDSGIGVAQISQALGHTSIKTTQIYLKELDERKMQNVCDNVIEAIGKKKLT